jgi:hypothetical protein
VSNLRMTAVSSAWHRSNWSQLLNGRFEVRRLLPVIAGIYLQLSQFLRGKMNRFSESFFHCSLHMESVDQLLS